jgi:hypothetical protein
VTPEVQRWIVVALVLGAVAFVAARVWRQIVAARRVRECGPGCGCG